MPELSLIQQAIQSSGLEQVLSFINSLDDQETALLMNCWPVFARPEQVPDLNDPSWSVWMYLGGRGTGKTRSGAEFCLELIERGYRRGALVARTAADVRDTLVEGEAGILAVAPPWLKPVYEPAKRRLVWEKVVISLPGYRTVKLGGARLTTYSGDEPNQLRGPSHDFAWADELAAWKYIDDAWANLMFGLRLRSFNEEEPRCAVTTTPRPLKLIRELKEDPNVFITAGTSYDNKSNLAPAFFQQIIKRYEGTRLGRQELMAEILDDNPNALFSREDLDKSRILNPEEVPELIRIHVGVDPAVTSGEDSNDTGIVVAGQDENDHYYVIGDYTCHKKPMGWATQVMKAYCWEEADKIIGEVNNGGDLIEAVIRNVKKDPEMGIDIGGEDAPYECVRATRGKAVRAEPVGAICEQGRLHIVGRFPELEDQLVQYDPELNEASPDRYDAMVWAIISIMKEPVPRMSLI